MFCRLGSEDHRAVEIKENSHAKPSNPTDAQLRQHRDDAHLTQERPPTRPRPQHRTRRDTRRNRARSRHRPVIHHLLPCHIQIPLNEKHTPHDPARHVRDIRQHQPLRAEPQHAEQDPRRGEVGGGEGGHPGGLGGELGGGRDGGDEGVEDAVVGEEGDGVGVGGEEGGCAGGEEGGAGDGADGEGEEDGEVGPGEEGE